MVDKKLTELDEITSVTNDDIIYVVNDPDGTPYSKKITVGNFINVVHSISNISNPPTSAELIAAIGTPDINSNKIYIIDDNGLGSNEYLIASDGGHYLVIPMARLFEDDPALGSITETLICTGGANSWYGRAAIKRLSNDIIVLVYRHASAHQINDGELHIRFSDDYGATWTDEDKYLDDSAVTNFPMNPSGAGEDEDSGEPWLIVAPNGDLILHMWCVDYGVSNHGTWQSISTDGGKTWGATAKIDFSGIASDDNIFATDDDFVYDGIIYIAARVFDDAVPTNSKSIFIKSEDNGTTWEYISDISSYTTDTQEVGFEYIGNNTIIMILRSLDNDHTYKCNSTDMGSTWSALVDITATIHNSGRHRIRTRSHLKGLPNWWLDSVLIMNGFTHEVGSNMDRINSIWISIDRGSTWIGPLEMDSEYYDGGYGDMYWDSTNEKYAFISNIGTSYTDSDLIEYKFSITGI